MPLPNARKALQLVLLLGAYVAVGKLGLSLATVHPSASAVWAASGVALAALLVLGRDLWPAIFLGAFLVSVTTAGPVGTALGVAAGNTLEAFLGAWLVERFAGGLRAFTSPGRLFRFAFFACGLCTALAATVGVASLALGGMLEEGTALVVWRTWWLGDAGGVMIVAPVLVLLAEGALAPRRPRPALEIGLWLLSTFLVGQLVFGTLWSDPRSQAPFRFLCYPPLLWAALRFGPRATAVGGLVLAAMAVQGTLERSAMLPEDQENERLLLLQAFLLVTLLTVQTVAASREALRESRERFRFLAETIPSIVWTADPDGTITYTNRTWLEYCGLSPDVSNRKWSELVLHPDDRERCLELWQHHLREGTDYEIEVRNRRHDGVYRWFVTRASPLKDSAGRVLSWFGVTMDIHEQKELAARLQEEDRRKDEFLALLAHELRNPLAPLRNGLALLRAMRDDPEIARVVGMMERQLGTMVRLVDDLMDINRIRRGRIELRRETIELAPIVQSAVETCGPALAAAGHALEVSLPPWPVLVVGDPTRLAQVLANLLGNAAKFTPRGGHLALSVEPGGDSVAITVEDDGEGIPPEMLRGIFEMFAQVGGSVGERQGGLGLGLAIVEQLVVLHGGTVEARSAGRGCGSQFVVRLPLAPEDRGARPVGSAGAVPSGVEAEGSP